MFKNILVPVDGSPSAALGLKQAIRLAKGQRATLTVLHVVDENPMIQTGAMDGSGYYIEDLRKDLLASGKNIVARALAAARKQGVPTRSILVESIGQPVATAIVKQANKARSDLIVIGTHGRRGIARLVMGSDAEGVVRQAKVPVVLVRLPDRGKKARSR
jgi:nucleotide-binding universal stress UspA family protein